MNKINIQYYKNQYAEFILGAIGEQLCLLDHRYRKKRDTIDKRIQQGLLGSYIEQDSPVLQQARQQLDEYFLAERHTFDIPIRFVGTDFQQQVWRALCDIPYGATSSYLALAKTINNEKAVRAVANANGANALSIIVPCHRIIGNNGTLVGYAGGLALKKRLLDLEQNLFLTNQAA